MLTGKLTCYLLDTGDCKGGNGYVPGGSGGGDPFGVNDDPWGPMVDPTSWDPLAEGEVAYEQHMYDDLYNAGKGAPNPDDPEPVDVSITVYCNSDGGVGWDCSLAGDSQKFVFDPYDHAHVGDRPAGELAQRVFQGNRAIWRNANQISDPRTMALWYGGSVIGGLALFPSTAAAGFGSVYDFWFREPLNKHWF